MDYWLFSADDHVDLHYLPADLWEKRVPRAYRDRAPRLVRNPDGSMQWNADGYVFSRVPNREKLSTFGTHFTRVEHEDGRWRPTTPELRLADMDRDRVEGQVLYGGLIVGFQQRDPELNAVCLRAYNEWLAEFCSAAPRRLIGLGFVPVHDADAAVAEIRHCAKLGLRGVQFQPFDCYKPVWHPVWDPLWAASAETGLSVAFHLGSGTWTMPYHLTTGPDIPKRRGAFASGSAVIANQLDEVLTGLVLSGALARYPDFHAVLGESSIGWIPYVLDRMDRKHKERSGGRDPRYDAAPLDELPSFYWRRQGHATFQDDPVGVRLLDALGVHTAMWASDYPHTDSVWPHSHATVDESFREVDPAVARLVLRDNARKLYGV